MGLLHLNCFRMSYIFCRHQSLLMAASTMCFCLHTFSRSEYNILLLLLGLCRCGQQSVSVLPLRDNSIDYLEFRLWIGLHSAAQCLILVVTDASFIIKYITRFTEEGFSTLISFIFIYDAVKKMIGAFNVYPINVDYNPDYVTMYKCECIAPDAGTCKSCVPLQKHGITLYSQQNLNQIFVSV